MGREMRVSKNESAVIRDLRESVSRVWETARRLGLMRLDRPVRILLLEIGRPELMLPRKRTATRKRPRRR